MWCKVLDGGFIFWMVLVCGFVFGRLVLVSLSVLYYLHIVLYASGHPYLASSLLHTVSA